MSQFNESAHEVMESYVNYASRVDELKNWLTADIVKLIQLLDAELQRRYDEENSIRRECQEAFQADLFNEQDYSESDPW